MSGRIEGSISLAFLKVQIHMRMNVRLTIISHNRAGKVCLLTRTEYMCLRNLQTRRLQYRKLLSLSAQSAESVVWTLFVEMLGGFDIDKLQMSRSIVGLLGLRTLLKRSSQYTDSREPRCANIHLTVSRTSLLNTLSVVCQWWLCLDRGATKAKKTAARADDLIDGHGSFSGSNGSLIDSKWHSGIHGRGIYR